MIPLPTIDVPFVPGARSSVVYDLQQWLQQRGLYSGELDGVLNMPTRDGAAAALSGFARSTSMDVRDAVSVDTARLSVGQVIATLQSASRQAVAYSGLRGAPTGSPMDGTPTLPDQPVTFTPSMMADTMKAANGGLPWWGWGLVGLGAVGLVGLGVAAARG